jgi:hypothetical protein
LHIPIVQHRSLPGRETTGMFLNVVFVLEEHVKHKEDGPKCIHIKLTCWWSWQHFTEALGPKTFHT